MKTETILAVLAILPVGAVLKWMWTRIVRQLRAQRIAKYLRRRREMYKTGKSKPYQHSTTHLMSEFGLTADQILQASNDTRKIRRVPTQEKSGMAKGILFEYAYD